MVSELDTRMLRYEAIDVQLRALMDKVKVLKQEQKSVGSHLMTDMQNLKIAKVLGNKINITLSVSVAQKSMTMDLLKDVFEESFPGRPEITTRLLEAIKRKRKDGAGERTRLKRIKKRTQT